MPKTHYLGFTKLRQPVGRASREDYGYRYALVRLNEDGTIHRGRLPSFSTTGAGARANNKGWLDRYPHELVEVHVVDAVTYRKAMAKK